MVPLPGLDRCFALFDIPGIVMHTLITPLLRAAKSAVKDISRQRHAREAIVIKQNNAMTLFRTFLALLLFCSPVYAANYKPYPDAQITTEQWQEYYDTVVAEFGDTRDEIPEARLVLFADEATSTFYAFTLAEHPAHPAWITRKLVEQDGAISMQQIGYFAGEEQAFADLFDDYLALFDQVQSDIAAEDQSPD
jgi:hypothetical protein